MNILEKIKSKNFVELRKYYLDNEVHFNGDYTNLLNNFYNFVINNDDLGISEKSKMCWTIDLAEHIYRSQFVIDSEINCAACFAKICQNA
jgi:hypothetical protein